MCELDIGDPCDGWLAAACEMLPVKLRVRNFRFWLDLRAELTAPQS